MPRKAFTAKGATAIGPYSQAIDSEGLVFLSGQTPVDPATGRLVEGDIGIAPTPNDPWAMGKCGFKIIQYMASALPAQSSSLLST